MTDLEAEAVASALAFDPLLIALHEDSDAVPEPESVIHSYIERALEKDRGIRGNLHCGRVLGHSEDVVTGNAEATTVGAAFYVDVLEWTVGEHPTVTMLRELSRLREVVRLEGPTEKQRIVFRHDRVKEHLLADVISDALSRDELPATSVVGTLLRGGHWDSCGAQWSCIGCYRQGCRGQPASTVLRVEGIAQTRRRTLRSM